MHIENNGGIAIVFYRHSFAEIVCCGHRYFLLGENCERRFWHAPLRKSTWTDTRRHALICDLPAGCALRLKEFEPSQVLGIDKADRPFLVVDNDKIVDAMAFEEVQHFDRELVLMHAYRIECHQIRDDTVADSGVRLEMSGEIAVRENSSEITIRIRNDRRARAHSGHRFEHIANFRIRQNQRQRFARPHDLMDAHEQTAANHSGRMKLSEILFLKSARFEQHHGERVAERQHDGRAGSRRKIQRTGFLFDVCVEHDVRLLCQGRFGIAAHGNDADLKPGDRGQNSQHFIRLSA